MEANYKLRLYGATDEDPQITLFFEEIGQAIIGVSTYGHEERVQLRNPEETCWYIKNIKDKKQKGEIKVVYGEFTKEGKPQINKITTIL